MYILNRGITFDKIYCLNVKNLKFGYIFFVYIWKIEKKELILSDQWYPIKSN
jgi:hypothetical protein